MSNVAINGGATHVAAMTDNPTSGGVDQYNLYDCTIATSACTALGTFDYYPQGAAASGSSYFFPEIGDNEIDVFTFGTSVVNILEPGQSLSGGGIAIDSKNVYWFNGAGLVRASQLGGTVTTVATLPSSTIFIGTMATDGTNVYFTTNGINRRSLAYAPVGAAARASRRSCAAIR